MVMRLPRVCIRMCNCAGVRIRIGVILALVAGGCAQDSVPSGEADAPAPAEGFVQILPGTTVRLDMVTVPIGEPVAEGSAPALLWMSRTEIPWEAYDVFVYRLDEPAGSGEPGEADAVTRPTEPYITVDRGFGHAGFPAISMSFAAAEAFCRWLTARTGRTWRLPTEAEWERACRAGESGPPGDLAERAWYRANAEDRTHPVGTRKPNAWGLQDLLGNAAEWCTTPEGTPVVKGGSFLDRAEALDPSARRKPDPSWNASDPQIPRSEWWLADASFVGFRVICESRPETQKESGGNER